LLFLFGLAPKKGLPCHNCYQLCGKLLPYHFTLTLSGGIFSVALSLDLRLPGVTWFYFPEEPGLSS